MGLISIVSAPPQEEHPLPELPHFSDSVPEMLAMARKTGMLVPLGEDVLRSLMGKEYVPGYGHPNYNL
ncbi:hypothetical protein J4419_00095 [Candidatus Woesearchaeota archaeon]|nr:hypothetical protein [Candidatus Woesearchaeota archaeon]